MNKYSFSIIVLVFTYIFLLIYLKPNQNIQAIRAGLQQKKVTITNQYQTRQQIIWTK